MIPSKLLLQKLNTDKEFVQAHPSVNNLRILLDAIPQFNLTGRIFSESDKIQTIGVGGFADVYLGYLAYGKGHKSVAVKRVRTHVNQGFVKTLIRELGIWSKLDHPYVLSFLGYSFDDDNYYPMLVSEWMANGTIKDYIEHREGCDLPAMILHTAEGLLYLHQKGIIHGDMKASNILVSEAGEPRICDFGISRAVISSAEATGATSTTATQGSYRWMATELFLNHVVFKHTEKTDVWAFGMTVCELLTNNIPYAHIISDIHVIVSIAQGITPALPDNNSIWPKYYLSLWNNICRTCWAQDPHKRPGMASIIQILQKEVNKSPLGLLHNDNSIMESDASLRDTSLTNLSKQSHLQIMAPTIALGDEGRRVIENGMEWNFTTNLQFAAISLRSRHTFVFYQVPGGGILQNEHEDGSWTGGCGSSPIFEAVSFSPLAVIAIDDEKGFRVYYLDRDYILQEYCYSAGVWYPGALGDLKIRAATDTSIAAIKFEDQGLLRIRVYLQESDSNRIMEYGFFKMVWSESPRALPAAVSGSSLSAVTYSLNPGGRQIRLFYQAGDLSIREQCFLETYWTSGELYCGKAPAHTTIRAIRYISSYGIPELHVYWKSARNEVVRRRHSLLWSPIETVFGNLKPGTQFTVMKWDTGSGKQLKLYYQNVNGSALEIATAEISGDGSVITL